jgi:thiol-disulfide isomerase/thioredoxin
MMEAETGDKIHSMSRYLVALFIMMSYSVECRAQFIFPSNPDSLPRVIEANIVHAKGTKAPELGFTNIETNKRQHLTDYLGKTLVLKFWYRGCKGCEEDVHVVSKLQDDYADQGLVVIYVDCLGSMDEASRYFEARRLDGNPINGVKILVDSDSLIAPFQGHAAPMTIVVDRGGVIQDGWMGPAKYERFESSVLPFVPKAPVKWQRVSILILVIVVLLPYFIYRLRHRNIVKQ